MVVGRVDLSEWLFRNLQLGRVGRFKLTIFGIIKIVFGWIGRRLVFLFLLVRVYWFHRSTTVKKLYALLLVLVFDERDEGIAFGLISVCLVFWDDNTLYKTVLGKHGSDKILSEMFFIELMGVLVKYLVVFETCFFWFDCKFFLVNGIFRQLFLAVYHGAELMELDHCMFVSSCLINGDRDILDGSLDRVHLLEYLLQLQPVSAHWHLNSKLEFLWILRHIWFTDFSYLGWFFWFHLISIFELNQ